MRGGPAVLAALGALVLGGLVELRCSLAHVDPPPPLAAPAPPPVAVTPRVAAVAADAAPAAAVMVRRAAPAPAPPRVVHVVASEAPALPVLPAPSQVPGRDPKPPIANKAKLRQETAAVQAELAECANQAARAGYRANGTAFLTFIVAPHDGAVEIETTGIEDDKTTIDNTPLLDCLRETARDMRFTFTPDSYAVYAMREVKFKDGRLTENKFIDFHYLR